MPKVQKNIPTEIDYTAEDVEQAGRRPSLPEGVMRFSVTDAKTDISKNDHLMIVLECAALKDPTNPNSKVKPIMRHRLTLPMKNQNAEGHKPPGTLGFCYDFLVGIEFAGVNRKPFRNADDEMQYGEEILEDSDSVAAAFKECDALVFAALKTLWSNPAELVDYVFWGEVAQNGDFSNIGAIWATPPEDAEFADLSELTTFATGDDEEAKPATKAKPKTESVKAVTTKPTTKSTKGATNGRART